MAVKTYTQSQLNNTMSGNNANSIYYATHGGTGNAPLVSTSRKSGNYATANKNGNLTYTIGGTPVADKNSTGSSGGSRSAAAVGEAEDEDYGYGRGYGGGGDDDGEGYAEGYGGGGNDYASMIAQMLAWQRAVAEDAYNKSRERLDSAYSDTYKTLKNNLNEATANMKRNYEYGEGVQRDDAAQSLREAYVNYMMNKRNLNQNLAAAGISGGATESNLANLYNNYGNSRNGINKTLAQNIAQLLNTYENNISSANQAYNSQWADARQNYANQLNQLEELLAGNLMSNYSGSSLSSLANFASTLADLTGDMGAAAGVFTPTRNTLGIQNVNTLQGNNMGTVTDYAKYLAMLEQMGA